MTQKFMTTITSNLQLPYNYGLHLPHEPRSLNWLGRTVEWIRHAESRGVFRKVLIYTLAFFTSILLCLSLVGLPLFVLGFKEYMIQKERSRYDQKSTT